MPQFIKSHSNYVLKKRHQEVSDGTIWERDITTIGGVNQFAPGQIPIYKSNNFIITIREDANPSNQHNKENWVKNNISGDVWTIESLSGETSMDDDQNDLKIVLKQDYYDFTDFAYYGSLSELFRASINDIFTRFPGELYITDVKAYYVNYSGDTSPLGNSDDILVSNPFGINIHSERKPLDGKSLKFFADDGFKNYEIINNGNHSEISTWNVTSATNTTNTTKNCKGDKVADITLNGINISAWLGDNNEIVYLSDKTNKGISVRPKESFITDFYNGCDNFERILLNPKTTPKYKSIFSVISNDDFGYTRNLEEFIFPTTYGGYNVDANSYGFNSFTNRLIEIGAFYDELFTDNLWRSMTHEAIKNFDWTFTREFYQGDDEEFVHGGEKIQKALRVFAREFDEILSYIDNIQNTNRVTYDERGNVPDYFLLDKLEENGWDVKMTYPFVKSAADGKYSQKLIGNVKPYNKTNIINYPNGYFVLPCGDDGEKPCYYLVNESSYTYSTSGVDSSTKVYTKTNGEKVILNRVRSYSSDREYTYVDANNEFMRRMVINSPHIFRHKGTIEGIEMILGMFGLKSKKWCKAFNGCDDKYTPDYDVTEYTRVSKRLEERWDAVHQMYRIDWINSTKTIIYDYRSTSNYTKYGSLGNYLPYQGLPISYRDEDILIEKCDSETCECTIETDDGEYRITNSPFIKVSPLYSDPSSGQSATCEVYDAFKRIDMDNEPVLRRYLYPNFDKYAQLDGNPYFQMNGGWLSKKMGDMYVQFDVDGNLVESEEPIYKETVRNIKRVDTLSDLLMTPMVSVDDGAIFYVSNIENNIAAIDDEIYEIKYEYCGDCSMTGDTGTTSMTGDTGTTSTIKRYISLRKGTEYIKVGSDRFFDSTIVVYDKNGDMTNYSLGDKEEGYEVKAYIKDDDDFICQATETGAYTIDSFVIINKDEEGMTNYFMIDDSYFTNRLAHRVEDTASTTANTASTTTWSNGWRRLQYTDVEYLRINTIENYYEGNNPHNGNMVYDNGEEYYSYFKRLFRHAIDNELFDERCYESYYNDLEEEIEKYNFEISDDIKDTKIHYFGKYYKEKDNVEDISSLTNGLMDGFKGYEETNLICDDVTDQIMNNKRFTITFYGIDGNGTKLKYIDDIVMNYLTQMIPSTTIVDIIYTNEPPN